MAKIMFFDWKKSDLEPKNRKRPDLGVLEVEVRDLNGSTILDANHWIIAIVDHLKGAKPLSFQPSDKSPSILSGEPGVLYRSTESGGGLEIPLTPDEMIRYLGYDLRPEEFGKLILVYGDHFLIHDCFYCHRTGIALNGIAQRIAAAENTAHPPRHPRD